MGNVLNKNFPSTKCKKCGEIINIKETDDFNNLVVQHKTAKENLKLITLSKNKLHKCKNGQIQVLHRIIGELYKVMTTEQIEKLKGTNQRMREELKKCEKEMLK